MPSSLAATPDLEEQSFAWGDELWEQVNLKEQEEQQQSVQALNSIEGARKEVEDDQYRSDANEYNSAQLQELDSESSEEEYDVGAEDGYVSDPSSTADEARVGEAEPVTDDDPMDWYEIAQFEAIISDGNVSPTLIFGYNLSKMLLMSYGGVSPTRDLMS